MITQALPSGELSSLAKSPRSISTQVTRLRYTKKNLLDLHGCPYTLEMTAHFTSGVVHSMHVSLTSTTHSSTHVDTVAHTEALGVQQIVNNLLSVCSQLGVRNYDE